MNPEQAYEYWKAVRGCGIKRAAQRATKRAPSKRTSREHGKPVRKARAKQFKWIFVTGGNVPLRHKFGLP